MPTAVGRRQVEMATPVADVTRQLDISSGHFDPARSSLGQARRRLPHGLPYKKTSTETPNRSARRFATSRLMAR